MLRAAIKLTKKLISAPYFICFFFYCYFSFLSKKNGVISQEKYEFLEFFYPFQLSVGHVSLWNFTHVKRLLSGLSVGAFSLS